MFLPQWEQWVCEGRSSGLACCCAAARALELCLGRWAAEAVAWNRSQPERGCLLGRGLHPLGRHARSAAGGPWRRWRRQHRRPVYWPLCSGASVSMVNEQSITSERQSAGARGGPADPVPGVVEREAHTVAAQAGPFFQRGLRIVPAPPVPSISSSAKGHSYHTGDQRFQRRGRSPASRNGQALTFTAIVSFVAHGVPGGSFCPPGAGWWRLLPAPAGGTI